MDNDTLAAIFFFTVAAFGIGFLIGD